MTVRADRGNGLEGRPALRPSIRAAAERTAGVVRRTPLEPFPGVDERVELRLKLECLQETGSFKARGAWNNLSLLSEEQRRAGVVATSSGNHGRALSWAAAQAGVKATVVMPADAYPNKIEACRQLGAEVVLGRDRPDAEEICRRLVERGATLVHPFDEPRTVQGAGTVGLEIAEDWPEVEVVVVPVGGGGLIAGVALAVEQELGAGVAVIGAEPEGAPTMSRALDAGEPVEIDPITTSVQGLCPLSAGVLNTAICAERVRTVVTLADEVILAAQRELVVRGGWTVEPAGAAAMAVVRAGMLPGELLDGRGPEDPLRVAAVVSGGNPDPEQLRRLREESERA
jgi:threonine dehydratase